MANRNKHGKEWYTPPHFCDDIRAALGGRIDLDPASCEYANQFVKALDWYDEVSDGLAQNWGAGNVYLNPPRDETLPKWIRKLNEEVGAGRVERWICITGNATSAAWAQELMSISEAICFPNFRMGFIGPDGRNISGYRSQMICYGGDGVSRFAEVYAKYGVILSPYSRWEGIPF